MRRRFWSAVSLVLGMTFALSCVDKSGLTDPQTGILKSIVDGERNGNPNFFWLPPTVSTAPTPTGPFDATLLDQLTVEVCELANGACAGQPVVHLTSSNQPLPERLRVDTGNEYYSVTWMTGRSHVDPDLFYRIRVLLNGAELGILDADPVGNTPGLSTVDPSLYAAIKAGQQFEIRFRVQVPTARTNVKVNEIESSGGVPGDWIELYNTADVPVSLGGYVVKDNDETHVYTLPADAMIPAGGFYVVEEAALGFGLGSGDAARFFTPDGAILVDSYQWTSHAQTTYGRCPDATGAFQQTSLPTKGAANDCSVIVRINEVESSGGVPGDWAELYNPAPNPADLGGYVFKDNDDTHSYTIPAGTIVAAGGYLVLDEASFGFGLGSADAARLFRPDGSTLDSYSWTSHATTTYGRCPNGTGAFTTTGVPTKGGANNCGGPVAGIRINEVESSGGTPGDWAELYNPGATPVDLSGDIFKDNDDTHVYVIPAGTTIPAGGYFMLEEAAFGFGLGSADAARLFAPDGTTIIDSYNWTAHATTTYGRCPNGTGAFITTNSVTKGASNDCGSPIRINEVESSGGTPGDWVELINPTSVAVNIGGYVFRDNDDTHLYTIPSGTMIAANNYYLLEEGQFVFGLGSADAARLYLADGTTLVDSYAWTAHAATTYGRCPNGTGGLTTTTTSTKGAANACPGEVTTGPWPGDATVHVADGSNIFGGNLSGLIYEGSGSSTRGVLWGARNGPGTLFRLVWNGTNWTPDADWSAGKQLRYPDGTGDPDAEGVTFTSAGPAGGMYIATERNNSANGISRISILRVDPTVPGSTLTATNEWNLTSDLPAVGANLGAEAIAWLPDAFLVNQHFFDESKGHAYNPAEYSNHGDGIFFVGLEANGIIYAYALNHTDNTFTRVATITSGFIGVMDLNFDPELQNFWVVCDDGCQGRAATLQVNGSGRFVVTHVFERPTGMPNLNNEGFTTTPQAECVGDRKPAYWSDDSETDGHAIREGTVPCTAFST